MRSGKRRGIITHWDLDGIASAVILSRVLNPEKNVLSSVNSVIKYIGELIDQGFSEIWIADLNPPSLQKDDVGLTLEKARRRGVRLYWFDHHQWADEMLKLFNEYDDVLFFLNEPMLVASELVANYLGVSSNEYFRKLVSLAYDDDFFENKYEITRIYRRVLKWDGWDIRYKVLYDLIRGELEPRWLLEYYVNEVKNVYENLIREAIGRMEIVEKNNVKIIVFPDVDPRVHPGELIEVVRSRNFFAHVYVVRYPRGVSLRSDYIDVSQIAAIYGGGGHAKVAGIPGGVRLDNILKTIMESVEKQLGSERPLYIG
ncbi:MAG: phosphohydrolase [Thermosphaera sp.]